jgi:hypothetical protein
MDDMPIPPISLPMPPNTGVRLRLPPCAPSFSVRLPPAPLPAAPAVGSRLMTISPQKRDRTNYPVGHFSIKRPKGPTGSREKAATKSALEQGNAEEEMKDVDETLSYSEYLEYIQSGAIGFFKLYGDIYVVQGWDRKRKTAKVRKNLA